MPNTLIIGAGNILLKDEGIGPRVIEELKKERLSGDIELIDAGTQILDTILSQGAAEKLIVVDAVKANGKPGSIYRFRPEDIEEDTEVRLSLHQGTVIEALKIMKFQNRLPKDVVIFGIEPKDIGWGTTPSDELVARIPKLIKIIKEEAKC